MTLSNRAMYINRFMLIKSILQLNHHQDMLEIPDNCEMLLLLDIEDDF